MFQFFYVYIYVYLNVTEIANKKKTGHAKMHVNVVKCVVNLRAFFSFIYDGDGHNRHIYCSK